MRVDYVIQTIKKNSIADLRISFVLFTIHKEIQIGFGKLLSQYKQKTDKTRNMTIFEKISRIPEISRKLASLNSEKASTKIFWCMCYYLCNKFDGLTFPMGSQIADKNERYSGVCIIDIEQVFGCYSQRIRRGCN